MRQKRRPWQAWARELLLQNPALTDSEIAKLVGVHRSTLARCQQFQNFRIGLERRTARAPRRGVIIRRHGESTVDGVVEDGTDPVDI